MGCKFATQLNCCIFQVGVGHGHIHEPCDPPYGYVVRSERQEFSRVGPDISRGKNPVSSPTAYCTFKGLDGGAVLAALTAGVQNASASSSKSGVPHSKSSTIGTGSKRLAARPATMKNQRQSPRLSLLLDAQDTSLWLLLSGVVFNLARQLSKPA